MCENLDKKGYDIYLNLEGESINLGYRFYGLKNSCNDVSMQNMKM